MLYHCTNAKRLAMKPTPPLPIYAERYPKGPASRDDPILLDTGGGTTTTTEAFFGVKPTKSGTAGAKAVQQRKVTVAKTITLKEPLEPLTQELLDKLTMRRAALAESSKIPAGRIISDGLLELLAHERPSDTASLLSVKGIGKVQQDKYGNEWLEVISLFLATNGLEPPPKATAPIPLNLEDEPALSTAQHPQTPRRTRRRRQASPISSPAFDTPPPRTPQLHTGLSFTMAGTTLTADADEDPTSLDSDESLPDLDFGSQSRQTSSRLKRQRIESPTKHRTSPVTQFQEAAALSIPEPDLGPSPPAHLPKLASPTIQPTLSKVEASETLSPRSKIARNKLLAFSKLVTRKLPDRPANARPIVTEHTLELVIKARPQTQDDLERIPGIDGFLLACEKTHTDLLKNVIKFAPSRT
ncbi:hypothetical protein T440DRAFT_393550 [Plenodomus tracheiphilus IPT5]|uniref:HRDC domain-containing protein n=1 Tax=Plenodomus tracheiphilus IPT5 TaxID=1408161 RepID=A0A6A7B9B5_9PLEO|nr:hypothetical protein T440DRAFT_393550 [Plenodomus tracheiphilus IPT5]